MSCPLYTNKEVFDGFNNIVEAFGGRALTEEEFRSSELRDLREGLDLSAMNAAYAIYDMNGGYTLDKAKNGEPSLLYLALLEANDGDVHAAIRDKAEYYTKEYLAQHGDWLADSVQSSSNNIKEKSVLILDGRKIGVDEYDQYSSDLLNKLFDRGASEYNAWEILKKLKNIISDTTDRYNDYKYKYLVNFLFDDVINSNSDNTGELEKIPIKFFNVLYSDRTKSGLASGQYNTNKAEIYISLESDSDWILTSVIHEMIHALTIASLSRSYNKDLKSDLQLLIDRLKKIESIKDLYGLTDPYEFVAEFFANPNFQWELLLLPAIKDTSQFKTLFHEVLSFILYVLKRLGVLEKDNATDDEKKSEFYKTSLYYLISPQMYRLLSDGLIMSNHFDATHGFLQGMYDNSTFPEGGREDKALPFLRNVNNNSLDENGEPIFEQQESFSLVNELLGILHLFEQSKSSINLGESLISENTVSSKNVINNLLSSGAVSVINTELAQVLSQHDIPVKLGNLESNVVATTVTDENGGSVIIINRNLLDITSAEYLADSVLHEVIHALTVPAIDNPISKEDRALQKSNSRIYNKISKLASKYNIYQPIFNNEKEFISIFATDKLQRQIVYDIAKRGDKAQQNTIKQHIKDFVNAITNKLFDSKVFLTNEELVNRYRQTIKDYLYNKQTVYKGNLTNKLLFDAVYNNLDIDVANLDKYMDRANGAKLLLSTIQRNNKSVVDNKSKAFEDIAQILNTRLKSIRHRSAQDDVVIRQQLSIKYQIDLITRAAYTEKIIGFLTIALNLEPLINEDLKTIEKVENGERTFNSSDFQTLKHLDIATYDKIAEDVLHILGDTDLLEEFVQAAWGVLPNRPDVTTPEGAVEYNKFRYKYIEENIEPLVAVYDNIAALSKKASGKLLILNRNITRNTLKDIFDAVKNPDTDEYLQKLVEIETDAGTFISQIRPMDYELDDALRALGYLVRKANRTADTDTYETIMPLLEGLDKLNKDLSLEDFYEKNGKNTTGYLVREFNYGKFYDDYADKMAEINAYINKKYGLNLLLNNRTAPDQDDARREFNDLRNTWLELNCHRRFVDAYYRAQADLPTEAVRQMRSINRLLFLINNLPNIMNPETGYPDYYKLTKEQWEILQEILVRKKMLRSDYDEWGNLKSPEELKIARAIQNYYSVLYKDNKGGFDKDRKAWVKARVQFLESLGAYGYYNEHTDTFNEKGIRDFMKTNKTARDQWNLWNERNSVHVFKQNQDKEALVFKQIENEMGSTKPYYGTKDEEYTKKINDLLNVYHGTNGHVNDQMMSMELIKKLQALMRKQFIYRQRAKAANPKLRALAKLYGDILHKYITFEKTERYKLLEQEALKQAMSYGSNDYLYYFIEIMKQYGSVASIGGTPFEVRPFRWFTNMKAIDEDMWMEWVPGDSFADMENSISYRNENFKEEYGVSYIPKGKKYDNSKLFNKIKDTQLYDAILKTMKKAYANMENRAHADPYLLPQITGSMYKYMQARAGVKGKADAAYTWLKDNIGLNGITQNDSDYGYDENADVEDNQVDESIDDKMRRIGTLKNTPDGHVMHFIPQFYTKRNRPEYISKDLIGIISTFYNMSSRYKHKVGIKDDCETIVDMLENRKYKKRSNGEREEVINGQNTGTYLKARKFLDMNLYGMRRTKYQVQVTPELNWEVTKTVDLLKRYTTANNLGANPKVALVGFLTTYYGHLINSIIGNAYSYDDAWQGAKIVSEYVIKNVALGAATLGYSTDIGKVLTDSSIINMMERFNLANQFERKTHHTNMDRLSRVVYENSVFGMLSSADFLAKATILVSVLHAFRLVDGEFVNKDGIYRNAAKISDENARERYITDKLKQYNSKNVVTMYDAVDKDAKSFKVKNEYKAAFDKAYYVVQATAEKLAERADGMATEEQKGMITQNIIGSLVLIHRQYLPLQWIESFGAPVYDMDMQTYKGGRFHVMYKYIKELAMQSTRNAVGVGAIIGAYVGLGGIVPSALFGAGIGLLGSKIASKYQQHKSVKEVNREFFRDTSSEKSILLSRHRQRVKNQVLAELAMCKVLQILVSMFCNFMDDPDKKNEKAMQFLALVLRQLEWETYSPYRGDDTLSSLKTASPVTGTSDDIQNGFSLVENYSAYLFSHLSGTGTASSPAGLLNTMFLAPEKDIFREMRSGPYEGDPYWEKTLYKLTPWSNTYEQYKDSKGKRKYLENQVFKLNK